MQCSRTCGGGTQKREVRCIGPDGSPINASERECEEEKRPVSKRNCNDIPCKRPHTDEVNEFESLDSENDVGMYFSFIFYKILRERASVDGVQKNK